MTSSRLRASSLLAALATLALVFSAAGCAADTSPDDDDEGDLAEENVEASSAASTANLLVEYDIASTCTIYINYPKDGVIANESWQTTGTRITWRYNVNDTWALVSDPKRAGKQYPWWGFTRRSCIKGEPQRIMEGRSNVAKSGWRPIVFDVPSAGVVTQHKRVQSNATLRDPANFVVGNVPKDWHVDVTGKTRSNGHWVEVYVPNAKRWGYIEASNVD